jgi:hypothetical protein
MLSWARSGVGMSLGWAVHMLGWLFPGHGLGWVFAKAKFCWIYAWLCICWTRSGHVQGLAWPGVGISWAGRGWVGHGHELGME